MDEPEDTGHENVPGGNAVAVDLMKWARAAEDQTGASGPTSRTA